jgi:hypothetical protein
MYWGFRPQFDRASKQDLVVIELSTLGGDPEVAHLMGGDIRFLTQIMPDRRFVFLGKAGSPGRRAARVSRERTRMPDRLAACSRATDQTGGIHHGAGVEDVSATSAGTTPAQISWIGVAH